MRELYLYLNTEKLDAKFIAGLERALNVSRSMVKLGLREKASGIVCLGAFGLRGSKKRHFISEYRRLSKPRNPAKAYLSKYTRICKNLNLGSHLMNQNLPLHQNEFRKTQTTELSILGEVLYCFEKK